MKKPTAARRLPQVCITPKTSALDATQPNAAQLQRALEKLLVVGRVLYVAAHPDDENTRLLSYLVGARNLRTAYLSLTRGSGGQNLIGSEQRGLLGMIRTQELLQARRIDGAEQFFSRARDFGYSKSSKETLRVWDHEAVLADVVWTIRCFRPDLIITRFSERGRTHGHHLASARLAREAFVAAADPKRFPEQLKLLSVWKADRLVRNVSHWRIKPGDDLSRFLRLDVGGYDPIYGASYGEIAARSRSMHKSQGFGAASRRGPIFEYFQPIAGTAPKKDLFAGLKWDWSRVQGGKPIQEHLKRALRAFRPAQPTAALSHLIAAYKALRKLPASPLRSEKISELRDVIVATTGLFLDARAKTSTAVPGQALSLSLQALNRSQANIQLKSIRLTHGNNIPLNETLTHHTPWKREHTLAIPAKATISAPSWLRSPGTAGAYAIPSPRVVQRPEDPAPLRATFTLQIEGQTLKVERPVRYLWTDRVRGELVRRVEIAPPITTTPLGSVVMFPNQSSKPLHIKVKANQDKAQGTLRLQLPPGWQASPASVPLSFSRAGQVRRIQFLLTPKRGAKAGDARPILQTSSRSYSWAEHELAYPHITPMTVLLPSSVRLSPVSLTLPSHTIGYIPGAGDRIGEALQQVGLQVQTLQDKAIANGDFKKLRTIVAGIRAFNVNKTLQQYRQRLFDWVEQGGTFIVQYNTHSRWRPLRIPISPLSLSLSRARVTDQNAPVTFVQPKHPILHTPHHLRTADFQGWVQERGLYFASRWDPKFQPILRMNDPGETPKEGSPPPAKHGKGIFIYTGISFFRQLPAGVPGAYRLFLNLLAHSQATKTSP